MSLQPEHGVVITLTDIYKQLVSLAARVDALTNAAEKLADHEARVRSLERARWPLPTITVLLALGSLAVAVIALYIKK